MAQIISKKAETAILKCLIVDDELIATKIIEGYLEKLDYIVVEDICSSAIEAAEILKRKNIDLMFLDINMPYLSGLEFLESLDKAPLTIITTAYTEYALEGFRLQVVDYLLKPFSFQRLFQATQKALTMFQSQMLQEEDNIGDMYIRQQDSFIRINWEDILYVESMQNYLKLHFTDRSFIIHQTMTSLEDMLPQHAFFRIHKSYLVNISHIETIAGGRLFIYGKELPISKNRREDLLNSVVYKNLISK